MNNKLVILLGVIFVVGAVVLSSAAYTVRETEQVLIRQFGEVQDVVEEPGLHFKTPFIQTATFFDKRVLDFDAERLLTLVGLDPIPTADVDVLPKRLKPCPAHQVLEIGASVALRLGSDALERHVT